MDEHNHTRTQVKTLHSPVLRMWSVIKVIHVQVCRINMFFSVYGLVMVLGVRYAVFPPQPNIFVRHIQVIIISRNAIV